ncbi:MAG: HNH endonuclease [Oscillospiraceae bacterium]|nr:HNH endonuclease [Oscillospiraceae bacterium]
MGYRDTFFNNNKSNHGWYDCEYCGDKLRKGDVDVDHQIAQARGGSDNSSNLVAACSHCNRQKGSMDNLDYQIWRDLYEDEIEERFEMDEIKYGYDEAVRRENRRKPPYIK